MKVEYCPNDPAHFATNLRRANGTRTLKWDNAGGQDVILVQTPFECNAVDIIQDICAELEKREDLPQKFTEISTGIWVRLVTASEKAKMGGCTMNAEACSYTVFACTQETGGCILYEPQKQAMISPHCNIPKEVQVRVTEDVVMKGVFRKKAVPTGFYTISFGEGIAEGYMDGDLVYKIRDFSIPITKKMVEQRTVFVKTSTRPEILSTNKGLVVM